MSKINKNFVYQELFYEDKHAQIYIPKFLFLINL